MISFYDWIFSKYPEGSKIEGAWGTLHIVTLVLIVGLIVAISFLRKKDERVKKGVIMAMAFVILAFELARRTIWFFSGNTFEFRTFMRAMLPRPWCAISCWFVILSGFIKKKWLYNYTAISGALCAVIFFAYPTVGFNNKYLLFENWYSIVTHSLLLTACVSMITLRLTDFNYRDCWKEAVCLGVTVIYAFIQIYLLKIEADPLFFMPNGEIQEIVGMSYPLYLPLYILFLCVYFSAYYGITYLKKKKR